MMTSKFTKLKRFIYQPPKKLAQTAYRKVTGQYPLQDFDDSHPCVFVLSTGRVGTQTLAALFDLSINVITYHEPQPKLYGLSKLAYSHQNSSVVQEILQEAFWTTRNPLLCHSLDQRKGYIETSPQVTFLALVICQVVPKAKFVHMVRDPRLVVRSGMRRKWYDGHQMDGTRITPMPDAKYHPQWQQLVPFQKNLWLWNETNRWILDFLTIVPSHKQLLIHAEDVFSGSSDVLERLFAFISSPLPPRRKIDRILGKRLNAQRKGNFPKPEQWDSRSMEMLVNMCGDTANQLGYAI